MLQYFDLFTQKLPHFQKYENQYKNSIYQTNLTCTDKAPLLILSSLNLRGFFFSKQKAL